jgi:hypothetical protein
VFWQGNRRFAKEDVSEEEYALLEAEFEPGERVSCSQCPKDADYTTQDGVFCVSCFGLQYAVRA